MANVRSKEELLKSFEDFMRAISWNKAPRSLYLPVEYILSIGGKRIRPLSLLLGTEILGGAEKAALHAAYGMELFHNFSLIHDDIMDAAELRRAKDSVHIKFGINEAILAGDIMMIESMRYISLSEKFCNRNDLQDLFIQTAAEVCEGQSMDMRFETENEIRYEEYLQMIRLKTAVLFAFGLKAAALISNRHDVAEVFYKIGIHMGIAFQLEDDLLDFYAVEADFGKIKAGDILQAKKSALVLELLDQIDVQQKAEFIEWYAHEKNNDSRISKMSNYFDQYNIHDKLKNRILNHQDRVITSIESLSLTTDQKTALLEFMNFVFKRKF